jgi:hypothetical protein
MGETSRRYLICTDDDCIVHTRLWSGLTSGTSSYRDLLLLASVDRERARVPTFSIHLCSILKQNFGTENHRISHSGPRLYNFSYQLRSSKRSSNFDHRRSHCGLMVVCMYKTRIKTHWAHSLICCVRILRKFSQLSLSS